MSSQGIILADLDGAHAAHVQQIAEAVLQVIELFLEIGQQPVGRVGVAGHGGVAEADHRLGIFVQKLRTVLPVKKTP